MRETKTIDLPSGLKADVVAYWTLDDYLKIEAAQLQILKSAVVPTKAGDGKEATVNLDPSSSAAAALLAITLAVKKLYAADGSEIAVTEDAIRGLHWKDGLALQAAVKEMEGAEAKK